MPDFKLSYRYTKVFMPLLVNKDIGVNVGVHSHLQWCLVVFSSCAYHITDIDEGKTWGITKETTPWLKLW